MTAIQPKPFSKLKFPIYEVPAGTDLVHKFKELQDYKEFSMYPHADRNNVIRYVIYLYDRNSDLVKEYSVLQRRKEAAAELAGFKRNDKDGKFKEEVYSMMSLTRDEKGDSPINDMIFCFLKMQDEMLWSLIVINENMFEEYMKLLMDPVFGKDSKNMLEAANLKTKLKGEVKEIRSDLAAFYSELYGENVELKEVKRKPISPETILKTLKQ